MTVEEHTKHIHNLAVKVSDYARMLLEEDAERFYRVDTILRHMVASIDAMSAHSRAIQVKRGGGLS